MIMIGDSFSLLATLPSESVQCCVTSPPYWGLRDYGVNGQLGLEPTADQYVANMRMIFDQVKRVLKPDGTLWLNLGDSYASSGGTGHQGKHGDRHNRTHTQRQLMAAAGKCGLKAKDLVGIPWRVAFALQADGWYLRQDIIWHKPNPMPESVRDRCTKAHEYIFLLAKSERYLFDHKAISEPTKAESLARMTRKWDGNRDRGMPKGMTPHSFKYFGKSGKKERKQHPGTEALGRGNRAGSVPWEDHYGLRNRRSVWTVSTKPFKGAHFATFPPDLIEPCILAGSRPGDTVLDPFFGAGTTGLVAKKHGREFIGIELNPDYAEIARKRLEVTA